MRASESHDIRMSTSSSARRIEGDFEGCFFVRQGLRVTSLPGRGVGVVTDKAVEPGEILVIELSLLSAPGKNGERLRRCLPRLWPRAANDCSLLWLAVFFLPRTVAFGIPAVVTLLKIRLNAWWLGVFDFGSNFNHSCAANAERVIWRHGVSMVVASANMAAGTEVTCNYGWADAPTWWRRLCLLQKYGFWCRCDRCRNGWPAPVSFPQSRAALLAICGEEGLDASNFTSQAVTLYELLSDRPGSDAERRAFGSAFTQMQLLLEQGGGDSKDQARHREEVMRLARAAGMETDQIAASCSEIWDGQPAIPFEDAVGPVAVAIWLVQAFRFAVLTSLIATIAAVGTSESPSPRALAMLIASVAIGLTCGAYHSRRPFAARCALGLWMIFWCIDLPMSLPQSLEEGLAACIAMISFPVGGLCARTASTCVATLERYEEYLANIARGGSAWGKIFVT